MTRGPFRDFVRGLGNQIRLCDARGRVPEFHRGRDAESGRAPGRAEGVEAEQDGRAPGRADAGDARRPAKAHQHNAENEEKQRTDQQVQADVALRRGQGGKVHGVEVHPGEGEQEHGEDGHARGFEAVFGREFEVTGKFERGESPERDERPGQVGGLARGVKGREQERHQHPQAEADDAAAPVPPAAQDGDDREENAEQLVHAQREQESAGGNGDGCGPARDVFRERGQPGAQSLRGEQEEGGGGEEGEEGGGD